jgi:hypothetical protein
MKCTFRRRLLSGCIFVCAVVSAATVAKAAVIVEAQGPLAGTAGFTTDGAGYFSVDYTVQSANTNVIVIGTYLDAAFGGTIEPLFFNGVPPFETISTLRSSLSYWPAFVSGPGIPSTILGRHLFSVGPTLGAYYVWELSNVDLGLGVDKGIFTGSTTSTNPTNSAGTIATSSSNRLVTNFLGVNTQADSVNIVPASGSIVTTSFFAMYGGSLGGSVAGGSGTAAEAGVHTLGWTTGEFGNSAGELAFAFAMPIPEPTTLVPLIGCVLTIAGRRRALG